MKEEVLGNKEEGLELLGVEDLLVESGGAGEEKVPGRCIAGYKTENKG